MTPRDAYDYVIYTQTLVPSCSLLMYLPCFAVLLSRRAPWKILSFADMVHFQLRINKFYTFTASAQIQVAGSPVYTFSIYAPALATALGLDQGQLQGVGSSMTLGLFLAIISGSAYDQLEHHKRMGPRITVWLGAALAAVGYGGLFLAATGRLAVSYTAILALAFIAGNSSSWYDTATIVTNVRNFPNNRGTVVGLLKSFVGLSGSIYSSVYVSSLAPDGAAYIGMLAVTSSLLPLLLSLGVNYVPYVELAEVHSFTSWFNPDSRFLLAYVTVVVLALYQMTSALLEGMGELPLPGAAGVDVLDFNTLGMFGILSVLLLVPWNSGGLASRYVHEHLANLEAGPSSLPRWWQLLRLVDHNEEPLGLRGGRKGVTTHISNTAQHVQHQQQHSGSECVANGSRNDGYMQQQEISTGDLAVPEAAGGNWSAAAAVSNAVEMDVAGPITKERGSGLREPLLQPTSSGRQQQLAGKSISADDLQPEHREVVIDRTLAGASPSLSSVECRHHFTNLSLSQAARTLQFWLLFCIFVAGVGSCLTFLNNLGQLTVALGGAAGSQVAFVSTYAVGNAAGRILMGQIPENHLHTYGTPRTKWLVAVMAALTTAVLTTAAATTPGQLYILAPALGLCYGGMFTLIPAIAADLFGLRHFAANYAGLQTACAVGSYVFPTQLAGLFYQKAVAEHGAGEPCIGRDCYGPTFMIEGIACLLAAVCSGFVLVTTKGVYQQLAQHLHEVAEEGHQDMLEQWHAEHHQLLVGRIPSDPGISATTGLPTGLYGQRYHRARGHVHAAVSQLQDIVANQQQQQRPLLGDTSAGGQRQQCQGDEAPNNAAPLRQADAGKVHIERQHTL